MKAVCEKCKNDWTYTMVTGGCTINGFLFCPQCEPAISHLAERLGEHAESIEHCPKRMAFSDWVLNVLSHRTVIEVEK